MNTAGRASPVVHHDPVTSPSQAGEAAVPVTAAESAYSRGVAGNKRRPKKVPVDGFVPAHKGRKTVRRPVAFELPTSNPFGVLQDIPGELETVLFGDSIVRHQDYEFAERMPGKRKVICKPGADLDRLTREANNLVIERAQQAVVIAHVGTNNLKRTRSEELLTKYRRFIETLKAKAGRVIISAILPRITEDDELYSKLTYINRGVETICSELGVSYLDSYTPFVNRTDMFMGDGIHLNDVGNARLGRVLHGHMTDYYASCRDRSLNLSGTSTRNLI